MLRSVDGGGEVDLDKRAITGEDDIIELDQLPTQHTGPEAKHDDSRPHPRSGELKAQQLRRPRPATRRP